MVLDGELVAGQNAQNAASANDHFRVSDDELDSTIKDTEVLPTL